MPDGEGEEREIVVENGDAALNLRDIKKEEEDKGEGESELNGTRLRLLEKPAGTGSGEDAKTDGGNVEIAFGEEIDADGFEIESRSKGEKKPGDCEGEKRMAIAKEEGGSDEGGGQKKTHEGKGLKARGQRESIEIVHADGNDEFGKIAGENRGRGEENVPEAQIAAAHLGIGGKTAQGRNTHDEIEHNGKEREEGGDEPGARTAKAGLAQEIFVSEKDKRKEEGGFLGEKRGQKREEAQESKAIGGAAGSRTMVEEQGEKKKDGTLQLGKSGDPGDSFRVHGMKGKPESREKGE